MPLRRTSARHPGTRFCTTAQSGKSRPRPRSRRTGSDAATGAPMSGPPCGTCRRLAGCRAPSRHSGARRLRVKKAADMAALYRSAWLTCPRNSQFCRELLSLPHETLRSQNQIGYYSPSVGS
jgi:hypothetical protein